MCVWSRTMVVLDETTFYIILVLHLSFIWFSSCCDLWVWITVVFVSSGLIFHLTRILCYYLICMITAGLLGILSYDVCANTYTQGSLLHVALPKRFRREGISLLLSKKHCMWLLNKHSKDIVAAGFTIDENVYHINVKSFCLIFLTRYCGLAPVLKYAEHLKQANK